MSLHTVTAETTEPVEWATCLQRLLETVLYSHVKLSLVFEIPDSSRQKGLTNRFAASLGSGVKYLSRYWGICTLLFYIFDNFYFTTFLKKIMYFLLLTFSLTPKSTCYILNA